MCACLTKKSPRVLKFFAARTPCLPKLMASDSNTPSALSAPAPLLFRSRLPAAVHGVSPSWLPLPLKRARNAAVLAALTCMVTDAVSLGLAGPRSSYSRAAAGIHAALLVASAIAFIAHVRFRFPPLVFATTLGIGLPLVFGAYLILAATLTEAARNGTFADGDVLALIFVSLVVDLVCHGIGAWHGYLLWRFGRDTRAAEAAFTAENEAQAAVDAAEAADAADALAAAAAAAERDGDRRGDRNDDDEVDNSSSRGCSAGGVAIAVSGGSLQPRELRAAAAERRARQEEEGVVEAAPAAAAAAASSSSASAADSSGSGSSECPICYAAPRNTAFVPCGHTSCEACARATMAGVGGRRGRGGAVCHTCRRPIRDLVRIYMS